MIEQTEHIHPLLGGHCIHLLEDIADYSYCTKNKEANNSYNIVSNNNVNNITGKITNDKNMEGTFLLQMRVQ